MRQCLFRDIRSVAKVVIHFLFEEWTKVVDKKAGPELAANYE